MKLRLLFCSVAATFALPAARAAVPYEFNVPEIPGYVILTGDFHVHTCFSDAETFPATRVKEAIYDDLDILAITDHLDSRHQKLKHRGIFSENVDQNTSYKLALEASKKTDLHVVHGAEITRGKRLFPAHFNAHFISDAVKITRAAESEDDKIKDLAKREETAAFNGLRAAREQKAFITFNHPNWYAQQPEKTEWLPFHEKVFKEGLIDGIEIVNHSEGYSPDGFHWAIQKGLTCVSGTDCHKDMFNMIDYSCGERRSRTLVFAKDNTEQSIREALFAGRTIVYYDNRFFGPEANVRMFFDGALKTISKTITKEKIRIKVKNVTSAPIILKKDAGSENLATCFDVKISPGEIFTICADPVHGAAQFDFNECDLNYQVLNYLVDADTPLRVSWHFTLK